MLYYDRPSPIALVDDDPDFLDMLRYVLPKAWVLYRHEDPRQMLTRATSDLAAIEQEFLAHQAMHSEAQLPISGIARMLQHWQQDGAARFAPCTAVVCDYGMPAMNGITLLNQMGDWPGGRILLTGQADERIAVAAFNQRLIHQFIPKQSADMCERLTAYLATEASPMMQRLSQLWQAALSSEQRSLLDQPELGQALLTYIRAQKWTEYVVLGSPFGVLGMTAAGQVGWLQLESSAPQEMAQDLLEMAQGGHVQPDDWRRLAQGDCTADMELRSALQTVVPYDSAELAPLRVRPLEAIHPAYPLRGAVFELAPDVASLLGTRLAQGASWADFCAAQP